MKADVVRMTVAEACEYAKCSRRTMERWIAERKVTCHRRGRQVIFYQHQLERELRQLETPQRALRGSSRQSQPQP